MSKVIMGNGGFYDSLSEHQGGRKQHKAVFVLSRPLLLNRLEPQSNKAKLLLPIMPIGIVAYAFTLFVGQPLSKQLYYYSQNHAPSEIWNVLPNMVFSPIWGENWRRSEHAHASYTGLSFRPPGFSPYKGREERRVQGLDWCEVKMAGYWPRSFFACL